MSQGLNNLLSSIKNGTLTQKNQIIVNYSQENSQIIKKLVTDGFIRGHYIIAKQSSKKKIVILLKVDKHNRSSLKEFHTISTPERVKVFNKKSVESYKNNLSELYFSSTTNSLKSNKGLFVLR